MPQRRPSTEIDGLKMHNNMQSISKLPGELLARIFTLADEERRARRSKGYKYYGFQDIAIEVCSHWRAVAVSNPTLWTYIFISRPPPHRSAALYLSRAGLAPLHLDLDFTTDFYRRYYEIRQEDDQSFKATQAQNTFDILVQHGASPGRWQSLIVCGWVPRILYQSTRYIHSVPCSSLRFLSIGWKTMMCDLPLMYEDRSAKEFAQYDNPNFGPVELFPQLRTARFDMFPARFLLKRPMPMLAGLRSLELTPGFRQFSLAELHTVLSSNPELETLAIYPGYAESEPFEPSTELQVSLPSLRSLTLDTIGGNVSFILSLMKIAVCPGLERLELILGLYDEDEIAEQILDRSYRYEANNNNGYGTVLASNENQHRPREPLYPVLQSLTISAAYPKSTPFGVPTYPNGRPSGASMLLSVLPTITYICAPNNFIQLLDQHPPLLPLLKRIKFLNQPPKNLPKILNWRVKQKVPVDVVEVFEKFLRLLDGPLPRSLTLVKIPVPRNTRFCRESQVREDNSRDYDDCSDPYGDEDDDPVYWDDDF